MNAMLRNVLMLAAALLATACVGLDADYDEPPVATERMVVETQQLTALLDRVGELETRLAAYERIISINGNEVTLTGNLKVVNGTGSTDGEPNGLGNVTIGYNAQPEEAFETNGSHMLVVGDALGYTGFGGIVVGYYNQTAGPYSSVLGGSANRALEQHSTVCGGSTNFAVGAHATVCGGVWNEVYGTYGAALGGSRGLVEGYKATTLGGYAAYAGGEASVAIGGVNAAAGGAYEVAIGEPTLD